MDVGLTSFEIEILDKIIPTQTLGNPEGLRMVIRNLITAQKDSILASGATEQEYNRMLATTGTNIFQFLRSNEFYYEREGGVFYLTEKGKQLRTQGTLQQYIAWRAIQQQKNQSDMREIQTKGYIDERQPDVVVRELEKKKKRFGFF